MIQALLDGRTADHCMGIPYFLGSSGGSRGDLLRALMFEDSGKLAGSEFQVGIGSTFTSGWGHQYDKITITFGSGTRVKHHLGYLRGYLRD